MLRSKFRSMAVRNAVQKQVDPTLLVADDVARAVLRRGDEAELLELLGHAVEVGCGEFAEFEPVETHRVDVHVFHGCILSNSYQLIPT